MILCFSDHCARAYSRKQRWHGNVGQNLRANSAPIWNFKVNFRRYKLCTIFQPYNFRRILRISDHCARAYSCKQRWHGSVGRKLCTRDEKETARNYSIWPASLPQRTLNHWLWWILMSVQLDCTTLKETYRSIVLACENQLLLAKKTWAVFYILSVLNWFNIVRTCINPMTATDMDVTLLHWSLKNWNQ